jgi:hypothetical protein
MISVNASSRPKFLMWLGTSFLLFAGAVPAQQVAEQLNYLDSSKYTVAVGVMRTPRFVKTPDDMVGMVGLYEVELASRRIINGDAPQLKLKRTVYLTEADRINNWDIVFVVSNDKDRKLIDWTFVRHNKLCLASDVIRSQGWRSMARRTINDNCVIL